jgi:hypothetical protein
MNVTNETAHLHGSCDVPWVRGHHEHLVIRQPQLLHCIAVTGGEGLPGLQHNQRERSVRKLSQQTLGKA